MARIVELSGAFRSATLEAFGSVVRHIDQYVAGADREESLLLIEALHAHICGLARAAGLCRLCRGNTLTA